MEAKDSSFQTAWWSFDLGNNRPCNGTYCYYEYDSIPPVDTKIFMGEYQWITSLDDKTNKTMEIYHRDTPIARNLRSILSDAKEKDLSLPDEFLTFMQSTTIQKEIPSCTACFFTLSDKLIKNPLEDDSYFIRFYNDQQDVLMWYLCCNKKGDQCVVVSDLMLDDEDEIQSIVEENGRSLSDLVKDYVYYCSPSFESFIYRIWIENTLWFALNEGEDAELSDSQKAYLKHYDEAK